MHHIIALMAIKATSTYVVYKKTLEQQDTEETKQDANQDNISEDSSFELIVLENEDLDNNLNIDNPYNEK